MVPVLVEGSRYLVRYWCTHALCALDIIGKVVGDLNDCKINSHAPTR